MTKNLEQYDNNSYVKTFVNASVKNVHTNIKSDLELFVKYIPIIDPIEELVKEYAPVNLFLPNAYNFCVNQKIRNRVFFRKYFLGQENTFQVIHFWEVLSWLHLL